MGHPGSVPIEVHHFKDHNDIVRQGKMAICRGDVRGSSGNFSKKFTSSHSSHLILDFSSCDPTE